MTSRLQQIIAQGGIPRPEGTRFAVPIERVCIEPDAAYKLQEWLKTKNYKRITMVSDANTAPFTPAIDATIISLPAGVKPEKELAENIAKQIGDVAVAVGSGTIGDLVKYASFIAGKPYVVLATAPSMNGYLSITASLLHEGHKESFKAQLPLALFADIGVLQNAPARLKQAGLGDAICRSTAQADWLLSHLLLDTYYDELPFKIVAEAEQAVMKNTGDIKSLMEWLLLGGLGMSYCGGSYPASQGEHMIAHTMEMLYPASCEGQLHGEQIAVTTVYMAKLQEKILAGPVPQLSSPSEEAKKIMAEKGLNENNLLIINNKISNKWSVIQKELSNHMLPSASIERLLARLGAPITPTQIGWKPAEFRHSCESAPLYRNRFTFLDITC